MSLVQHIQSSWAGGEAPENLPTLVSSAAASSSPEEILAALQLDLQLRWQSDRPLLAEDYLAQLPELPQSVDWPLELAVAEWHSRPLARSISPAELESRFPELTGLARHLVQIPANADPDTATSLLAACLAELQQASDGRPQLEFLLANLPVTHRNTALLRLVSLELAHLQQQGATIIPESWLSRFPRHRNELSALFGLAPESAAAEDSAAAEALRPEPLPARTRNRPQLGTLGDYELLSELGRGGMGIVYRARQRGLNRIVALKTVLAQAGASADDIQRFRNEAEAAAHLRHPGIVAVFDVGQADDRHYYSMEFIEGDDLSKRIREHTLPGEQAARFLKQLAEAVQYAHEHGVLHRDLKPSNVLIDHLGVLKITDFGLARRMQADSQITREFSIMGTPSYMPPEQAMPTRGPAGPWSDIYSLGAVLYELLTARPPFRADNPLETMRQVVSDEPIPPRLLNPKIALDLQTICLKCLEKDPARRYDSARTLAEELGRYLEGKPIIARPLGIAERFWRFCKRHPRESILAGTILATIFAAVIAVASQWRRAEANLRAATRNFDLLNEAADEMLGVVEEWVMRAPPAAGSQEEKLNSSLSLFEKFLYEEPANIKARRRLAETHLRVSDIRRLRRDFSKAVEHQQSAIQIFQRLSAAQPNDRELTAALAAAWDKLGNTEQEAEQPTLAASAFEQALSIQLPLLELNPSAAERSDVAKTWYNRGLLRLSQNQLQLAAEDFEQSIAMSLEALKTDPGNRHFRQGLARCHLNFGVLKRLLEDPAAALREYDLAATILAELTQQHPTVNEYAVELAQTQLNRGNLLLTARETNPPIAEQPLLAAQSAYADAVQLLTSLSTKYPNVPHYSLQLANALNGLGGVQQASGQNAQALETWTLAKSRFLDVLRISGDSAEIHSRIGLVIANIALLIPQDQPQQRIPLLEDACSHQRAALRKTPEAVAVKSYLRSHLLSLARALLLANRHAPAANTAEELAALRIQTADLKTAAELLLRAAAKASEDQSLPTPDQAAAAQHYTLRALAALRQLAQHDPTSLSSLENDPKFAAIREHPDFQTLLKSTAGKPSN